MVSDPHCEPKIFSVNHHHSHSADEGESILHALGLHRAEEEDGTSPSDRLADYQLQRLPSMPETPVGWIEIERADLHRRLALVEVVLLPVVAYPSAEVHVSHAN